MKLKRLLYTVLLSAGCMSASAQAPETVTVEEFNHHWFVQGQAGAQYTLGEIGFGKLISPNIQVAGGYQFTPVWGLRLAVNAWQSKGGSTLPSGTVYKWKWNYIAPTIDVTCDLVNLICGYKPDRVFTAGLLGGIGVNIAFNNDEAIAANNQIANELRGTYVLPTGGDVMYLDKLWGGTIGRFMGRFGAYADFRLSKRVSLGVEFNANTTSDIYNSKEASNLDWYFNALAGVKVKLGKTTKQVEKKACCGHEKVVEKIVEKIVEKPVEKIVYRDNPSTGSAQREPLRKDIFFTIRNTSVSRAEMTKVEDIAAYLNKYPEAKVVITGYADKGTGNAKINEKLAMKRSQIVADLLTNKFGIDSSRITVDSKGDTVQPFEQNDLNRVSICIAE